MMTPTGKVEIKGDLVKIDHLTICGAQYADGAIVLTFYDRNKRRSASRGNAYIEITLSEFIMSIVEDARKSLDI